MLQQPSAYSKETLLAVKETRNPLGLQENPSYMIMRVLIHM